MPNLSAKAKKRLFYLLALLILSLGPVTVYMNQQFVFTSILTTSGVLRISGLLAFSFLFIQLMLGNYMDRFVNVFGGRAYVYHIVIAFVVLFLITLHPFTYSLSLSQDGGLVKLLTSFLPRSISEPNEVYVALGRISYVILLLVFIAGYFRTRPFLRRNWKLVHYLSFVAFYTVSIHSWNLGSDTRLTPFIYFYIASIAFVTIGLAYSLYKRIKTK